MDTVDETNRLQRSWGPCSQSMKDDLKYILDIFRTSFRGDIIKEHEYRNHLMMITINCNDAIENYLPINETLLAKKIYEKEQEKKAKNTITGLEDDRDIYIIDTTELEINFNDSDKTRTYKQVFEKYNLLNYTYDNTIFKLYADSYNKTIYVRIETNIDNTFDIKTTEKKILNDTLFTVVEIFEHREHGAEWIEKKNYKFTSIAIINDKEKAIDYNQQQLIGNHDLNGGYAKSSKFKTKEVLGKLRRIYKIPNSKKEHIKHKGNLITVSEYKAVMKLKNKIYK